MNGLPQHDVARLRKMRLAALAIAWVFPVISGFLHGHDIVQALMGFVWPSPRKAVLLVGIGLQVYRLVRPSSGKPRVYEYVETQGEIGILGLLLFFDLAIGATNRGMGGDIIQWIWSIAGMLMMLGLYAGRLRVVIDGNARTVTIGDLIPRTKRFDQIPGLGTIQIRRSRNGVFTGTTYRVGLFTGPGKPRGLDAGFSEVDIQQKLQAIMMETGLQVARA